MRAIAAAISVSLLAAPPPAAAAQLVYSRPAGLFVARADGTHGRQITTHADREPRWSPDGKRIAFTREDGPRTPVWVVNADGSGAHVLVDERYSDHPRWSPLGNLLAYDFQTDYGSGGGRADTKFDLHLVRPGGGGDRKLAAGGAGLTSAYSVESGTAWAWSPDGRTIAFERTTGDDHRIALADVATGTTRTVARGTDVAWSPTGQSLAIGYGDLFDTAQRCRGISVVARRTGRAHRISRPPARGCDTEPAWSPDGRHVAFVRTVPHGASRVDVVAPDGSGARRLATGTGPLRWTGGGRLLFARSGSIFAVSPSGGQPVWIADGADPDWHP